MFPTLPQSDRNPAARQAQLNRARAKYTFVHAYQSDDCSQGVGLLADLPYDQQFTLPYLAQVLTVDSTLLANQAAIDLEFLTGASQGSVTINDWFSLAKSLTDRAFFLAQPTKAARRIADSFPLNLEKYNALFALIGQPEIVSVYRQSQSQRDRAFAWQRLAGANPMVLRGITTLSAPDRTWITGCNGEEILAPLPPGVMPANFPVDNALYQRVMGTQDSLEKAAAEHRLYLADYRLLMNLPQGTWRKNGLPQDRYLYAPLALFAWQPGDDRTLGAFKPVAIQCQQWPVDASNPIFTPLDGYRWQMAQTVVQCADGVLQEMVHHLGYTHMVIEAAIVAAYRNLAPSHPIYVLLDPHFQFTLALNDYATKHLIAPGGQVDALFGTTLEGSLTALVRGLREYNFSRAAPPKELADRRVDNVLGLPDYPYRDDALRVWQPLQQFVQRYVALYYGSDEDVQQDWELQHFLQAFGDPQQGNISGVPTPLTTREQLVEAVATLIFTATAQHSALNYAQFPFMGYVPNLTGALYAPAPTQDTPQAQSSWLAMLPPTSQALQQFVILYQLSNVRFSVLGQYEPFYFEDRRVDGLVQKLRQELALAETAMQNVDQYRFLSYPYLQPSTIGNSIFI
ncbi:lipoxygenase family protein [Alkalinema pantanalense CENA528]|uniref:lipoxygenase family protein n=1 Tax=Alkalinema pantanalense TaxID=1620705 RepID=UPI003D6EE44D